MRRVLQQSDEVWADYYDRTRSVDTVRMPFGSLVDFVRFDSQSGEAEAILLRTLDTLPSERRSAPGLLQAELDIFIAQASFREVQVIFGEVLVPECLGKRTVVLGVPYSTSSAQWEVLNDAVRRAREVGVKLNILKTRS